MGDKKKPDIAPPEPEQLSGCVVCGDFEGELSGKAGKARWHADCEANRPDVIAKVKARA